MLSKYHQINQIVRKVPKGQVVPYGQIALYVERWVSRMVSSSCMAALSQEDDALAAHHVSAQSGISPQGSGQ